MTNKLLPNERELLLQLSQGSTKAFEKIYDFYSPLVYGKLLKMLKSKSNADELLQDVFLKVWEHRQTIDADKPLGPYIFRITLNKAYDFFRKESCNKKLSLQLLKSSTEGYHHVEDAIISRENAGTLYKAINSLPPQRRQIFVLCKLEGKSYKQVSVKLGVSTSTISDHIVKATHYIRRYFMPQ